MFGFPVNLQDSGVQKFTNDADNGFPKIQQREIFYSVKDGNWGDPTIWQTASGRVGKFPGQFDDVYIRNNIVGDTISTINRLFVSGVLTINPGTTIGLNGQFIGAPNSRLTNNGTLNFLTKVAAEQSYSDGIYDITTFANTIGFIGNYDATIPSFYKTFHNLTTYRGIKTISTNTTINNNLKIGQYGSMELATYNLIVNGLAEVGENPASGGLLTKYGDGNILFAGTLSLADGTALPQCISITGNVITEFRNGITGANNYNSNWGTGSAIFTTNNQTISPLSLLFNCDVFINSGIEIINTATNGLFFSKTINGLSSTSKLTNRGLINFTTQLAAETAMSVGVVDFTTTANTIGYAGNYTATIPSYFTTFHNLTISGTGTKSLGVNTTLNGNLNINAANLSCGSFNLQVGGITNVINVSNFTKTGSGNLLFIGNFAISTNTGNFPVIDFSLGNPSLEFRGGMSGGGATFVMKLGTNTARFTTNNQSINFEYCSTSPVFDGPVLIEGINLTLIGRLAGRANYVFNNSIDGTNASSTFTNQGWLRFNNILYTNPMATNGTFIPSSGIYAWLDYAFNGNFTIPAYTTINSLSIQGTGTKTLSANLTTNEISSFGTLDLSTFNLVNNGVTNGGTIKKSGAGTILFVGSVSCAFDFSGGNPNVEFRNGFNNSTPPYITGNGQFTFSTNNQVFQAIYGGVVNMDCSILISGAITLSIPAFGPGVATYNFNKVINGDNAASKFLMNTNSPMTYNAATQPMATGILDTFTNANTWIYGSGNQDIKGGPTTGAKQVYRNLTLNGGGTKTLQGYVSVQNTYTLTSPATLNNNGFTLTNP